MNRHSFRWESLAFGAFYLAIVGNWAVWEQDILTPRELSVTASVVLIAFGLLGILVTLRTKPTLLPDPGPAPEVTHPTTLSEGNEDEETDPQS